MKEYRIMAYFKDNAPKGNQPRSFRRKVVSTSQEAEQLLQDALLYYERYAYIDRVIIESREITEWKEDTSCNRTHM